MHFRSADRERPISVTSELATAVRAVSTAALRRWVERISVPRHFVENAEANRSLARWLAAELAGWGYQVTEQGPYRNLVVTPPTQNLGGKSVVLVGAHYDSVPLTPGADDNGSAVAALLGCAQRCAHYGSDLPVIFVLFNREEDGLLGSIDWVANHLPGAGYEVACAHVLEMVGFACSAPGSQRVPPGLPIKLPDRGDFIGLLGNRASGAAMKKALQAARTHVPTRATYGVEVLLGLEKWFPVLQRSDHAPFWQAGIPALMWTDTSEFRNPHYHQATDRPETLDYGFLTDVTRVLTATVIEQANMLRGAGV